MWPGRSRPQLNKSTDLAVHKARLGPQSKDYFMNTETPEPTNVSGDTDPFDVTAFFVDLRALQRACGFKADKHSTGIVLISACIDNGVNTRARIVGVLRKLNFKESHVVALLRDGTGGDPSNRRWWIDEAGCYHNQAITVPS